MHDATVNLTINSIYAATYRGSAAVYSYSQLYAYACMMHVYTQRESF